MDRFIGADTQALIEFARKLRTDSESLEQTRELLAGAIARGTWIGPDSEAFSEQWQASLIPKLSAAATSLGEAGRKALQNAIEQDKASDSLHLAAYGDLLQGESWSDVINWVQDTWPWKGDSANYATDVKFDDVRVDAGDGQSAQDIYGDIKNMAQGSVGDCWLMSALAATAAVDPGFMDRHINANDDGTWTVTIYENGEPVEVTVSPGDILANGAKNHYGTYGWMSVYEAAALKHQGGELYKIVADTPAAGLEMVTGQVQTQLVLDTPTPQQLQDAIAEKRPITAMSDPILPLQGDVAGAHVYVVKSYNPEDDTITLENPWGGGSSKYGDEVKVPRSNWNFVFTMTAFGPSADDRSTP